MMARSGNLAWWASRSRRDLRPLSGADGGGGPSTDTARVLDRSCPRSGPACRSSGVLVRGRRSMQPTPVPVDRGAPDVLALWAFVALVPIVIALVYVAAAFWEWWWRRRRQ